MLISGMRTKNTLLLGTVIGISFALLGGIGWFFVEIGRSLPKTDPPDTALPTLVKNLPEQTVEIEPAFRQRVHAQYPDGMTASLLARDLRSKGFHLYSDHKNGLEFATLEQRGFPCV